MQQSVIRTAALRLAPHGPLRTARPMSRLKPIVAIQNARAIHLTNKTQTCKTKAAATNHPILVGPPLHKSDGPSLEKPTPTMSMLGLLPHETPKGRAGEQGGSTKRVARVFPRLSERLPPSAPRRPAVGFADATIGDTNRRAPPGSSGPTAHGSPHEPAQADRCRSECPRDRLTPRTQTCKTKAAATSHPILVGPPLHKSDGPSLEKPTPTMSMLGAIPHPTPEGGRAGGGGDAPSELLAVFPSLSERLRPSPPGTRPCRTNPNPQPANPYGNSTSTT